VQLFACLHWQTLWNRSVPQHLGTLLLYRCRLLFPQDLSTACHYIWSSRYFTSTFITTIQQLCCSLEFSKSQSCRNFKFAFFVGDMTCTWVTVGANNSIVQRSKSLGNQNGRPFALNFVKSGWIYIFKTKMLSREFYTCHWIRFTDCSAIFAIFAVTYTSSHTFRLIRVETP